MRQYNDPFAEVLVWAAIRSVWCPWDGQSAVAVRIICQSLAEDGLQDRGDIAWVIGNGPIKEQPVAGDLGKLLLERKTRPVMFLV